MKKQEPDIFSDIDLLLCVSKIYGFFSFKLSNKSSQIKHISHEWWHFLYGILLQTGTSLCGFIALQDYSRRSYKAEDAGLFYILNMLTAVTNVVAFLVNCIYSKISTETNKSTLQALYEIEKNLHEIGIMVNHNFIRSYTRFSIIFTVIVAFTSGILVVIFDERRSQLNPTFYFAICLYYHCMCINFGLINTQFALCLLIINHMFAKMEDTLRRKFMESYSKSHVKMLEIARIQQELWELGRQTYRLLSIPLLLEFLAGFCLLSGSCFSSAISIINNVCGIQEIINIIWAVVVLISVTVLVVVSNKYMSKVSDCLCDVNVHCFVLSGCSPGV